MFAGRRDEIAGIGSILAQTRAGNAAHFLAFGERGIGKSSLMVAAEALALQTDGDTLPFLVVSVTLTRQDTEAVIATRIATKLQQKVGLKRFEDKATLLKEAWEFVKRIEVGGTRLNPAEQITEALDVADKLVTALEKTAAILEAHYAGIVILIDEADAAGHALGSLLKRTIDTLGRGDDRVCFGVAGLPELPGLMKAGHESSLRGFRHFLIEPLEREERKEVVDLGLKEAKENFCVEVSIDDDAAGIIASISDGYPHFIQQFAYSAYDSDSDFNIDAHDVFAGATCEGGAFACLGNAIFHSQFFREVRSTSSREVLRVLSDAELSKSGQWVSKNELRKNVTLKATTLTSCLKSLSDKHIILKDQERLGYYRLPSWGFAFWIRETLRSTKHS